jgi:hypothetical protein
MEQIEEQARLIKEFEKEKYGEANRMRKEEADFSGLDMP